MRWQSLLLAVFFLAISSGMRPAPGEAAGPWKAQVVDAETGQPLEGVVVLAVWYRRYTSPGGWAGGGYYASEEVVTGPEGRFVIQARATWTLLPFLTTIQGPEILIFKPGYGRWQIRNPERWSREQWENFDEEPGRIFVVEEGVVIELPPLKMWKERRDFVFRAEPHGEVPSSRVLRYLEAIDQERISLGLKPIKDEKLKWEKERKETTR